MIIKTWNGTDFIEHHPKTIAAQIYSNSGTGAETIFDNFNKIKPKFLPDSVFDSLEYKGTLFYDAALGASLETVNGKPDVQSIDLATTYYYFCIDSGYPGRSEVGLYFVASVPLYLKHGTAKQMWNNKYYKATILNRDSQNINEADYIIEAGDWVIIDKIIQNDSNNDGSTSAKAIIVEFAIVNNTYELASDTSPGIVKLGSGIQQTITANSPTATAGRTYPIQYNGQQQLVVNVPWTDDNTWKKNTKDQEGYVTKGTGNVNKVWKTDASGNPDWRDDEDTEYTAANGITLDSGVFGHSNAAITGTSKGPTADASPSHGGTFKVPYITYDNYGHITAAADKTITLPSQYSLPTASVDTLGGVKLGAAKLSTLDTPTAYSQAGKYYPVQTDKNNKLVVNVPWTDTPFNYYGSSYGGIALEFENTFVMNHPLYIGDQNVLPAAGYRKNGMIWFDTSI